ncbi:hypothetical protein M758_9G126400 [Ceratodon purpureus]|uniref:Uncharacterized protein n=1 Tax=Ceratodon purpureus TaxID=3225 RepID=A0A8T0GV71_CERPU|nr:hypothetical protein KC19_9G112200 [Ceratodon purpureus]KAG0606260.1 hypothetical protein M758_9G126400 [Ceratodon purpureus]
MQDNLLFKHMNSLLQKLLQKSYSCASIRLFWRTKSLTFPLKTPRHHNSIYPSKTKPHLHLNLTQTLIYRTPSAKTHPDIPITTNTHQNLPPHHYHHHHDHTITPSHQQSIHTQNSPKHTIPTTPSNTN